MRQVLVTLLVMVAGLVWTNLTFADVRFERVADNVYVELQDQEHPYDDANVVVITGSDATMIIDAPADGERTRAIATAVGEMVSSPVRYLVNTHWHSDHTQGNHIYREVFGPGLRVVGHVTLIDDVPGRAAKYVSDRLERLRTVVPKVEKQLVDGVKENGDPMTDTEKASLREAVDRAREWMMANQDVTFIVPDIPYDGAKTIDLGDVSVTLKHYRAHTRGDTVILVDDTGVVITGDMVDALPYVGHGYLEEWVAALGDLLKREPQILVPGHGPVFTGTGQVTLIRDYIQALLSQTQAAVAEGRDLEATRSTLDLAQYRERFAKGDPGAQRFFDAVLGEAVERAWLEARGEAE